MKKSVKVLLLVLAVLLALTGVGLFAVTRLDTRAKQEHAALSGAVEARMNWISGTRVALTENGARRSGAFPVGAGGGDKRAFADRSAAGGGV